jgi:hypothetical protein
VFIHARETLLRAYRFFLQAWSEKFPVADRPGPWRHAAYRIRHLFRRNAWHRAP